VGGRRDGQELGQSLDDSEECRSEQSHRRAIRTRGGGRASASRGQALAPPSAL
jgi:hypothetical protein